MTAECDDGDDDEDEEEEEEEEEKKHSSLQVTISNIFMIHDGSSLWQLTESQKLQRKPARMRMRIQEKRQDHGKMKMIIDEEER
jgi:hypothetical protein